MLVFFLFSTVYTAPLLDGLLGSRKKSSTSSVLDNLLGTSDSNSGDQGRVEAKSGLGWGEGVAEAPNKAAVGYGAGQGLNKDPGSSGYGSGHGEGKGYTADGQKATAYGDGEGGMQSVTGLIDLGYGYAKSGYNTEGGQQDSAYSRTIGTNLNLPVGTVQLAPTISN